MILLLGLVFHMDDNEILSDTINIFLFPDLYLVEGLEALMVA